MDGSARATSEPIPPHRDRLVIIGRRRSGKTIFLARLYEALWNGCLVSEDRVFPRDASPPPEVQAVPMWCHADTGPAHRALMSVIDELKAGRWPTATLGTSFGDLLVSRDGRERRVRILDYPGEVFRRAFMEDSQDADARQLRDSIDRAAAAVMLADPGLELQSMSDAREDSYGLFLAARQIRRSPGGVRVPIALVLTKCDDPVNRALLNEAGGAVAFAERRFPQLLAELGRVRVYACTAVRTGTDGLGRSVPLVHKQPRFVVQPIHDCLRDLEEVMKGSSCGPPDVPASVPAMDPCRLPDQRGEGRRFGLVEWLTVAGILLMALVVAVFAGS